MKLTDKIQFRYKGNRHVKGIVISFSDKQIELMLLTNYIGKNEEWFVCEKKTFNKSEMKNILILTK